VLGVLFGKAVVDVLCSTIALFFVSFEERTGFRIYRWDVGKLSLWRSVRLLLKGKSNFCEAGI
jgi:hypothetical protein